jgi:excisionase family DNA binding protein
MSDTQKLAASAAVKVEAGILMTLAEVAARLDVSPMTVHRLPLRSIRIGRLLRFDPKDVDQLIEQCKEAVVTVDEIAALPTARRKNKPAAPDLKAGTIEYSRHIEGL